MTVFTDNFTGTDDDAIDVRSGWDFGKDGLNGWVIYSNGATVKQVGGGSGATYIICTDQGSANHYSQWTVIAFEGSPYIFLCCRLVDENNFVGWYLGGGGSVGSRLCKCVASTVTDLVTVQGAASDVVRVECNGNNISFYIDDVQQGDTQTVTDHNTETSQGMLDRGSAGFGGVTLYDDFEAGPMATAVEVSAGTDELELTEYDAGVNAETNVNAGYDELTLTEYSANVALNVDVSAGVDALTLTEYSATVKVDENVLASTDELTLTEYNATVDYTLSGKTFLKRMQNPIHIITHEESRWH